MWGIRRFVDLLVSRSGLRTRHVVCSRLMVDPRAAILGAMFGAIWWADLGGGAQEETLFGTQWSSRWNVWLFGMADHPAIFAAVDDSPPVHQANVECQILRCELPPTRLGRDVEVSNKEYRIMQMKARPAIKYRQLQYFLAVADSLHFSKAAERLFVTQPTLSHQLAELESQIGTNLFDRTGGSVRLTQAGEIFRKYAKQSIDAMEEGCAALAELEGLQRGELCLGVTQSFNRRLMPPIIGDFRRRYPAVRLHIQTLTAAQIERQLAEGTVHLGIAFAPAKMEETEVEAILAEHLVLVVRRDHPLALSKEVTWAELAGHPLVLLSRGYSTRQMIDGYFAGANVEPNVACETDTIDLMFGLAVASDLAAVLPESAVETTADLAVLSIAEPVPMRTSALMWPRHRHRTQAAQAFATIVKERFPACLAVL